MTKREVRAKAREIRAGQDMKAIGSAMAELLFTLPCWQQAHTVLAFSSLPNEPDTGAILQRALAEGKRLLLPRVTGKGQMDWVEIPDLALLQPGAYGIPEPPANLLPVCPPEDDRTLLLIPCMAASSDGVRLGHGGGYYDRFLAHAKGKRLLLCPAALVLPEIPAEAWDIRFAPEEILTEKGFLR